MGRLSTHVLDTMHGCPAGGMRVELFAIDGQGNAREVVALDLNADGRNDGGPLLDESQMQPGRYRLQFHVADYFRRRGVTLPEPPFVDVVTLDFGIANPQEAYHVPLLVSPWSYSTYRGS